MTVAARAGRCGASDPGRDSDSVRPRPAGRDRDVETRLVNVETRLVNARVTGSDSPPAARAAAAADADSDSLAGIACDSPADRHRVTMTAGPRPMNRPSLNVTVAAGSDPGAGPGAAPSPRVRLSPPGIRIRRRAARRRQSP